MSIIMEKNLLQPLLINTLIIQWLVHLDTTLVRVPTIQCSPCSSNPLQPQENSYLRAGAGGATTAGKAIMLQDGQAYEVFWNFYFLGVFLAYSTTACFSMGTFKERPIHLQWMKKMVGYSKTQPIFVDSGGYGGFLDVDAQRVNFKG